MMRKAKIFTPPNTIKSKIGSGGLDPAVILKAEHAMENNGVDFKPIALGLLQELAAAIESTRKSRERGEAFVEKLLCPAAQFKAQGPVFHFPIVGEIADTLISFLETVRVPIPDEALEIVSLHRAAITAIIGNNIKSPENPQAQELKRTLLEACAKYYRN